MKANTPTGSVADQLRILQMCFLGIAENKKIKDTTIIQYVQAGMAALMITHMILGIPVSELRHMPKPSFKKRKRKK